MLMVAAVLVALTALPSAHAASSGGKQLPPTTRAEIDEIVEQTMQQYNVPGFAVGVWRNGKQYVAEYGVADLADDRPFVATDHVRIASNTKTYTGTAVLQLVDQKKLALDDTLSEYVSGVPNGDQITVEQLLNMTAGTYDYTQDDAFNAELTADPTMEFTTEDLMAILARHDAAFAPGTSWMYSDTNYAMLGLIVEEVTGRPIGEVITEEIVDRLELRRTSYPTSTEVPNPRAVGYLWSPTPGSELRDVTPFNPDVAGAAGAMISTLPELETWSREVADGTLLKPATQRARLQFVDTGLSPNWDIGYGLGAMSWNGFVGHNGAIYGYNSAMFSLPKKDATIIVVSNASNNFEGMATDVFVQVAEVVFPKQFPTSNTGATTTTAGRNGG